MQAEDQQTQEGEEKLRSAEANSSAPARLVFLSYASADSKTAQKVCEFIESHGVQCWMAPRDVRAGARYADAIVGAINEAHALLLVLSQHSVASGHVGREVERAASKRKPIIAFRLDASQLSPALEYFLSESQWVDVPALGMQAALAKLQESVDHGGQTNTPVQSAPTVQAVRRYQRVVLAAVILVVAGAAATLGLYYWSLKSRPADAQSVAAGKTIAVLPFVDMSESHDQEYFADGMAEEILGVLAKIPHLVAIGRTSSFQFKGKNEDLREIGNKLGATYIVEGSVRKSGTHIRVTSQLVETMSGRQVWSEIYDRDFGDTLILQTQIAVSIARALQLAATSQELAVVRQPVSMEAYNVYLRGRVAFDRGDVPSMVEAEQDFAEALSLDPSFARAAEGVLLSYINRIYADAVPNQVGWPRVQQLAGTVLQLDAGSAFAHSALAWFHFSYDYDWSACNHEIDTVIAARSNDPTALIYAAYVAGAIGRSVDGVSLIRQALILDPLNPDAFQAFGGILSYEGDYESAEHAYRKSLDISPSFSGSHLYIGETRLSRGNPKDALSEIEAEPASPGRDALLAGTYFVLGMRRDSDASLQRLLGRKDADAFWKAAAYALRSENDLAFEWLNTAFENKDLSLSLRRSNYFANLREDPRWKPLLQRMNIPDQ